MAAAVAGQLQAASAKIIHAYRVGNWYLLYVDTPGANQTFLFYRGDPTTRQYVASWSRTGAKAEQSELRNWARLNAPGVPESLGRCFASSGASGR
jgi:hypothetical protein